MLASMLMPLPHFYYVTNMPFVEGVFGTEVCDLDTHNESEPSGMWTWQLLYQEQDGYVLLFPLQCFVIRFYALLCHQTVRSAAAGIQTPTPAVFSALRSWFASHATSDVCFPPTAVCHHHTPLHPTKPQPAHHTGPPSFVMLWKWFDAPGEWASRTVCVYVTERSRTEQCTVLAQSSRRGLD